MKNKLIFYAITMLLSVLSAFSLKAQDSATAAQVKNMIESKKYSFEPTSLTPSKGSTRQLTSLYELKMIGDSLFCDLPYFGRAYNVAYSGDGGFKFSSTDFDYSTKSKNGKWDIVIKTKSSGNSRQFYLTIFNNGTASLRVLSNDRDPISYYGNLNLTRQ
jgi:hypothetical protein